MDGRSPVGTGSVTREGERTSLSPKRMRAPSGIGVTILPGSRFPSVHADIGVRGEEPGAAVSAV